MQLNYNNEFAEVLRSGTKIHTIRRKEVQPGTKLTHVIYPYQRERREMVLENACTACQWVEIKCIAADNISVRVANRKLSREQVSELLTNDGLNWADAQRWFGGWYTGYIIHWTDKRY